MVVPLRISVWPASCESCHDTSSTRLNKMSLVPLGVSLWAAFWILAAHDRDLAGDGSFLPGLPLLLSFLLNLDLVLFSRLLPPLFIDWSAIMQAVEEEPT
jgi:hypothetical protein